MNDDEDYLSEIEDALPEGFRVDAEHNVADRVKQLAEYVDIGRGLLRAMKAERDEAMAEVARLEDAVRLSAHRIARTALAQDHGPSRHGAGHQPDPRER